MLKRAALRGFQPNQTLVQQGYHVQLPWSVAWGDMNAMAHVDNTVYFKYFESARLAYFDKVKIPVDVNAAAADDMAVDTASKNIHPIIGHIGCTFRKPLVFPDDLILATKVTTIHSNGKFILHHAVWSENQEAVVAVGEAVTLPYNYETFKKSKLPVAWEKAIIELDNPHLKE